MKIKVEIDVEDLVTEIEEEGDYELMDNLKLEIKNAILQRSANQILERTKQTVAGILEGGLREAVNQRMNELVNELSGETVIMEKGNIRVNYNADYVQVENVTLDQFIRSSIYALLGSTDLKGSLQRMINSTVKVNMDAFKETYDTYFATQVVKKLADNNMLSESVTKMLKDADKEQSL